MIKGIIHRLLLGRHFWRHATFDEVGELYASRLLRVSALRFASVFASVYLFNLGYSLAFLGCFWAGFYALKAIFTLPAAKIVAHFGPKHGTLYSNILAASSMVLLFFEPKFMLPGLIAWCAVQAIASCLYDVAYLVDFSKVKNVQNSGKEIGYMSIVEKVATNISPIVGGFIATLLGPTTAILFSAGLFLLSAVPLFRTGEPTRLGQKLSFRGFPWRMTWRTFVAEAGVGVDTFSTGNAWTLFIAVMVFAGDGDAIYAKIGILTSLTLLVAMVASYVFGRLTDRNHGLLLLRSTTWVNALVHLSRLSVSSPIGVLFVNAANDVSTTGYSIAFTKGLFDTADRTGARIVYLMCSSIAVSLGGLIISLVFALCASLYPPDIAFAIYFIVAAAMSLVISMPRFPLYKGQ